MAGNTEPHTPKARTIGIYHSQPTNEPASYYVDLEQARQYKQQGSHYFIDHGRNMRAVKPAEVDTLTIIAAGTMRDAWQVKESAGFLVLQMKTQETCA